MRKLNRLLVVLLIGFIFRLSLVFVAHHGDLNNNITWGTLAVERGLVGFYEGKDWPYSAPNQPPLTILMLTGVRVTWQAIENVMGLVKENGLLCISIYNDQGKASQYWRALKRFYNRSPKPIRFLIIPAIGSLIEVRGFLIRLIQLQNPLPFKNWAKRK